MTQVKMPEPVAWMLAYQTMGGDVGWKLSWTQSGAGVCLRLSGEFHEKPLITTDQAEAYAAAKVRESLVQAESILRGNAKACKSLAVKVLLSANADAIGELIPPLPGPVEPTT